MSGNQEYLDLVSERIGAAVIKFCEIVCGKTFFADDLRKYVRSVVGEVAPGSPDRILRDLRQKGKLGYRVVSRRESIYEALWIGKPRGE